MKSISEVRKLNKTEQLKILENKSTDELLLYFMDKNKLMDAKRIPDDKIRVIEQTSKLKKYKIIEKEYIIEINITKNLIYHDCLYWKHKCVRQYRLCKHVGKVLMIIFEPDAKKILIEMISSDDWAFLEI